MKIYISTGLNTKITTTKLIKKFTHNNIRNIELSSGFYEKNIFNKIKKLKANLLPYTITFLYPKVLL